MRWVPYSPSDEARSPASPVMVLNQLASPQLGGHRDILVCVPPGYERLNRELPVLYMQDGQNLFDRGTSFAEEWRVDEVVKTAAEQGTELIVVGIPHGGPERLNEYSPFRDPRQGGGRGDAYLSFLIDTVRPAVDAAFPTRRDAAGTGIAGSSMGGLISVYGAFARPDIFGMVAAMSPALWFARRAIFPWLSGRSNGPSRIYLDAGTREGPIVMADVAKLRDVLTDRGYRQGRDLHCLIEAGGGHDEISWGRRLLGAIRFMLAAANGAAR